MQSLRPLQSVLQAAVGAVVLAALLRCWVVLGVVAPVRVSGSSMAPVLKGDHVQAECGSCGTSFAIGAEYLHNVGLSECYCCGQRTIQADPQGFQYGDYLVVDRTATTWKRHELVVLRNPEDAKQLCVKRILGLPGEEISVRNGNVCRDGKLLTKTLSEQRAVRQLVHRQRGADSHWSPQSADRWILSDDVWRHEATADQEDNRPVAWLEYRERTERPLTDNVPYNLGLSRQLNPVGEVMVAAKVCIKGQGTFSIRIDDGQRTCEVRLGYPQQRAAFFIAGEQQYQVSLPNRVAALLPRQEFLIEFSNFDQQLLLAIDGETMASLPLDFEFTTTTVGTSRPASIGARGVTIELQELQLYRDLFYTNGVAGRPFQGPDAVRLGSGEYYLLGDNSPVSLDSRCWGPVPRRLFVGRPIGFR